MELDDAALAYAALGQPTRLELLLLLLRAGPNGMAAGGIAAGMGVPPSSLSFHLRALEHPARALALAQGPHAGCRPPPCGCWTPGSAPGPAPL